MAQKHRYVQVGTGCRAQMFTNAIIGKFAEHCEIIGLCDSNTGRMRSRHDQILQRGGPDLPLYPAHQFDRMIAEQKPDTVIVTTKDCTHDDYICRAMEQGCDVITEKPLTTTAEKCRRILDTQRRTGRQCRVTFNYRYSPPRTQLKDLLMSGVIGNVLSIDFQWMLDTHHGADYYRRWHRNKKNSGGLMVHKATHHFDLVNWWLSAVPRSVYAKGRRGFYTPKQARRYGLHNRSERCCECAEAHRCAFAVNLDENRRLRNLYRLHEHEDGYFRDRCVFSSRIDIEDSMHAIISYDNGITMSYTLTSFMPWEGYRITFNGAKGRIEHYCRESVYINGDGTVPGELILEGTTTRIFPHFDHPYDVEIWKGAGGHGGGDAPLLEDIFLPHPPADRYLRAADQRSGAYSILCGVAANRSMESDRPVAIRDLVAEIEYPDYPLMPSLDEPIPMHKPKVKKSGVYEALRLQRESAEKICGAAPEK